MRIFKRLLILLSLSFVLANTRASASPCDVEVSRKSARLIRAVEMGLRDQIFLPEDVELMIQGANALTDPWLGKERDILNISLRQKMSGYAAAVPQKEVDAVKAKLREILRKNAQLQNTVADAREQTAFLFKPQLLTGFEVGDVNDGMPFWHKDKTGKLQLINYNHKNGHLQIFDPEKRSLDHDFTFKNPSKVELGLHAKLTTADGGLWIAQMFINRLGLHDAKTGKTHYYSIPDTFKKMELTRGADGEIYLIVMIERAIQVYRAKKELEPVKTHSFESGLGLLNVVTSRKGEIRILVSTSDNTVFLLNPFQDTPLQKHRPVAGPASLGGIFTNDGDFVAAIVSMDISNVSVDFFSSKSSQVLETGLRNEMKSTGQLHLTTDGRVLFPIREKDKDGKNVISVFEPLEPQFEKRPWWRQRPNYLVPTLRLEAEPARGSELSWSVTEGGRTLLLEQQGTDTIAYTTIYEPLRQTKPLVTFPLPDVGHLVSVGAEIPLVTEQLIAFYTHSARGPFDFYLASEAPVRLFRGPSERFTPIAHAGPNKAWIAGIRQGFGEPGELHVYSLYNREVKP